MPEVLSLLPPSLPGWLGASGVAGVGFAFTKWFLEWVGGRMDKRAAALDAGTQRLIEGLEKRLDSVTERLNVVERDLADCKLKHADAEAEVMRLQAMMQGYGDARQRVQTELSAGKLTVKKGE